MDNRNYERITIAESDAKNFLTENLTQGPALETGRGVEPRTSLTSGRQDRDLEL
jgi:hypothetical protein